MTLYIDEPRQKLGRMIMAHMTADRLSELLRAADALQIDRRHLQGWPDRAHTHFDICKRNWTSARDELGARVVRPREIATRARTLSNWLQIGQDGPRPPRLVLSRKKGARLPAGAASVARPHKWGNPHNWQDNPDAGPDNYRRGVAVELHAKALLRHGYIDGPRGVVTVAEIRRELAGRPLACWCKLDEPCHAETLITLANGID